jgi:hypothetical protein
VTRPVGRLSRAIDLLSLVLVVAGAALYLRAYFGMEAVRTTPDTPFVRGTMEAFALLNQHLRFKRLSWLGLALVGAGILVGLSAAIHARKISQRTEGQIPIPE